MTQNDIEEFHKKKHRNEAAKNMSRKPLSSQASRGLISASFRPPGSSSARYNEPLKTGQRVSRGSRGSRGATGLTGSKHFVVDQADREAWVNFKPSNISDIYLLI